MKTCYETWVYYLTQTLVSHPEEVVIYSKHQNDGTIAVEIKVDQRDFGKLQACGCRTIAAIQDVVSSCAKKSKEKVKVSVFA